MLGSAMYAGLVHALAAGDGTAEEVWSYANEGVFVYILGEAARLPSGNTLIVWSTAGQVQEVTPGGELVWSLDSEVGGAFGLLTFLPHPP